jgi:hypothetical protein
MKTEFNIFVKLLFTILFVLGLIFAISELTSFGKSPYFPATVFGAIIGISLIVSLYDAFKSYPKR